MGLELKRDIFDHTFCKNLFESSYKALKSDNFQFKTNYSWPGYIIKSSHPVLVRKFENDLENKIKESLISKDVIGNSDDIVIMNYVWTKLSYIPWHKDTNKKSITVYLNPLWEIDWGGIFFYKDNKELKCILPEYNMCLINDHEVSHSVSTISLESPVPRITVQIFVVK